MWHGAAAPSQPPSGVHMFAGASPIAAQSLRLLLFCMQSIVVGRAQETAVEAGGHWVYSPSSTLIHVVASPCHHT